MQVITCFKQEKEENKNSNSEATSCGQCKQKTGKKMDELKQHMEQRLGKQAMQPRIKMTSCVMISKLVQEKTGLY